MSKLIARIERNRKILGLTDRRAKSKAIYVLKELEEEEEAERAVNSGLSNREITKANADLSSLLAANGLAPVD
jgi:hypothetical protein